MSTLWLLFYPRRFCFLLVELHFLLVARRLPRAAAGQSFNILHSSVEMKMDVWGFWGPVSTSALKKNARKNTFIHISLAFIFIRNSLQLHIQTELCFFGTSVELLDLSVFTALLVWALPEVDSFFIYVWAGHLLYSTHLSTLKQKRRFSTLCSKHFFFLTGRWRLHLPHLYQLFLIRDRKLPKAVDQLVSCVCFCLCPVCMCECVCVCVYWRTVYSYLHVCLLRKDQCVHAYVLMNMCMCCARDNISPWVLCWSQYLRINYPEGIFLPFPHTQALNTQLHTHVCACTTDTNTPMGHQNVTIPCLPVPNNIAISNQRASWLFFLVLLPNMKLELKAFSSSSSLLSHFISYMMWKWNSCTLVEVQVIPFKIWLEIYTKHQKCVFVRP